MCQVKLNSFLLSAGILLFVLCIDAAFSLDCYECNSKKHNSLCNDSKICSVKGVNPACMKSEATIEGIDYIVQDCISLPESDNKDRCDVHTIDETPTVICFCFTNLCNDAKKSIQYTNSTFQGLVLQCYECDTNTDPTTCTNHLTKDCFPGEICVKSDRILNGERIIKKGCIQSLKHENKCEVKEDSEDLKATLCLCSTDLCNSANVKTMSKLVATSLILMVILINFDKYN